MAELPLAYISHATSGRLRLKVPSKKTDQAYFAFLRERLSNLPGVREVVVNPTTGSVLVYHTREGRETDLKTVAEYTEFSGLFRLQISEQAERLSIAEQAAAAMEGWNRRLKQRSNGTVDFQSLAFLSLVGVSLVQASRGNIMIPAITALWYASSILKETRETGEEEVAKTNGKRP